MQKRNALDHDIAWEKTSFFSLPVTSYSTSPQIAYLCYLVVEKHLCKRIHSTQLSLIKDTCFMLKRWNVSRAWAGFFFIGAYLSSFSGKNVALKQTPVFQLQSRPIEMRAKILYLSTCLKILLKRSTNLAHFKHIFAVGNLNMLEIKLSLCHALHQIDLHIW